MAKVLVLSGEMKLLNDLCVTQKYLDTGIIKGFKNKISPKEILTYIQEHVNEQAFLKTWFITGFKPKGDGYITCYYCGRSLTNTQSRILGCGPICHDRYGDVPGRSTDTEIIYNEYLSRVRKTGKKIMSFKQYFSIKGGN